MSYVCYLASFPSGTAILIVVSSQGNPDNLRQVVSLQGREGLIFNLHYVRLSYGCHSVHKVKPHFQIPPDKSNSCATQLHLGGPVTSPMHPLVIRVPFPVTRMSLCWNCRVENLQWLRVSGNNHHYSESFLLHAFSGAFENVPSV